MVNKTGVISGSNFILDESETCTLEISSEEDSNETNQIALIKDEGEVEFIDLDFYPKLETKSEIIKHKFSPI